MDYYLFLKKDSAGNWPGDPNYTPTFSNSIPVYGISPYGGGSSPYFSFQKIRFSTQDEQDMLNSNMTFAIWSNGVRYEPREYGQPEDYYYLKFNALLEWYNDTVFDITTQVIESYISVAKSALPPLTP